jgi:EAL domain-containing protein (putative c-di-GMP-specific phosphodiesterase class I)
VLAAEVIDALADVEASDIPVRIVAAVAEVLGIPVIARSIPSDSVTARLVAAGCRVGGFALNPEEPVKEIA